MKIIKYFGSGGLLTLDTREGCKSFLFSKTVFSILSAVAFLSLAACSTPSSRNDRWQGYGVAVIGVTAKSGLTTPFNRNILASEFAGLLNERSQVAVLPALNVRQILGVQQYDDLMQSYAKRGSLDERQRQLLLAARLPARTAVLARLEEDYVNKLPARRERVTNRTGAVVADRENSVLATQRITRLSAVLIDLQTGDTVWRQQYEVGPATERVATEYLGSSFSGSLAAAFANTMINGVRVAQHPDAPPLRLSLRLLLAEVASNLPLR